ncbi:DNA-binding transcriptional regulator GalS [mine drainage metagenome]|uniref:DNA-binding transcriptional regulator GalS n=1 Tax=mine drainage metagenome TaxID=410659 RepID=A0A1J5RKK7_9ZZZZ
MANLGESGIAPRVTLRDVARVAAVHVSTVSLALRDSPLLRASTRLRVQGIARELGYTRDSNLDALVAYRDQLRRMRNPTVIGYITNWDAPIEQVPHHRGYLAGAVAKAREIGFRIEHFSLCRDGISPQRLNQILVARGIRAIILSSFYRRIQRLELDWSRFSAVRIESQPEWPSLPTVSVNHLQVIKEIVGRVYALGYRRPGFMLGEDWSSLVDHEWEMGFSWAQRVLPEQCRIPPFFFLNMPCGSRRRYRFREWFERYRPDVLLAPHWAVEERRADFDLKVPRDVAVADPFLEVRHPSYAGMVCNLAAVGANAVTTVAGLFLANQRGIPDIPVRCYVHSFWSEGASCPERLSLRRETGD